MFSREMDVVLAYRAVPDIINDSLSERTMSAVNVESPVICESAKWAMVFKLQYIQKRFSQVAVNNDGLSGNP